MIHLLSNKWLVILLVILLTIRGMAIAATSTFQEGLNGYAGTQDTWFSNRTTNGENAGFPNGTYLRTGTWSTTYQQAVLRFEDIFDNDSGPIPIGSTIYSATLTIYVDTITYADGEANALYKMLVDWVETDAADGGENWAGGVLSVVDTDNVEAAAVAVDDSTEYAVSGIIPKGTQMDFDVTSIVQDWSNGDDNYGFLLDSLGLAAGNGLFMVSSDHGSTSLRPTLEISYDESEALVITQTGGTTSVEEAGADDTYTVELSMAPDSNVYVDISDSSDPNEVTVQPETLTFTSSDWNIEQTVTVTAIDDSDEEGPHSTIVNHSTISSDPNFTGLSATVDVSILDDDLVISFEKGPYLIYPGDNTEMTVLWQLNLAADCNLKWGEDTSYTSGSVVTTEYGSDNQHKHTISYLKPGVTYYYCVEVDGTTYEASFKAGPRDIAQNVRFLAYGDTRSYPSDHETVCSEMVDTFTADPNYQTFTVHVGDWVNADSESDWTNQFFDRSYVKTLEMQNKIPIQGCVGNHEFYGSSAVVYDKYWPYTYPEPSEGRYYSFDYGPAHVVVLDNVTYEYPSDYDFSPAQIAWLENDLQSTDKEWKFVVLHAPGWAAGHSPAGGGWSTENNINVQTKIQPLCETYGVDVVFAGHFHYYSRCDVNGVQHVTTGGGGAPLYSGYGENPPYIVAGPIQEFEFCKVNIQGNTLDFEAVKATDGSVIDSFSLVHALDGDINNNGRVDLFDYSVLASQWLIDDCPFYDGCYGADMDRDWTVNEMDLEILSDNWLDCPVITDSDSMYITEFMAINDSFMIDGDGDFSDWIEIYNADTKSVDLYQWYLTDDPGNLTKWRFPSVELNPGEFLVVYASGKDKTSFGQELHTNFLLSDSGYLALVKPDGSTIAYEYAPSYPAQSSDIAYGLTMDDQP